MNEPNILFADEPTGALNSSTTKEVMDIFHKSILKEQLCFSSPMIQKWPFALKEFYL